MRSFSLLVIFSMPVHEHRILDDTVHTMTTWIRHNALGKMIHDEEDVRRIREGMCVGGDIPDSIHVMMVNVNGHMYRSMMTKEVEPMFEFLGMDAGNLENMMDLINGGPARLYHVLSQICHSHMNGGLIVPAYGFIRTRSGTVAPQVRFQFKTQSNERLPDRGSYNARILPT